MGQDTRAEKIVGGINRAVRLSILLAQRRKKFEQLNRDFNSATSYTHQSTFKGDVDNNGLPIARQELGRTNDSVRTPSQSDYFFEKAGQRQAVTRSKDYITIVDLDWRGDDVNKKFYRSITLPFVPRSVQVSPESNFVGIATLGRNNPNYHFVGSEDTIRFEIDWFSQNLNREDVIFNCRWLESMSKSDGYLEAPHKIKLVWGKQTKLFKDDEFICVSAGYTLSDFVDNYKKDGRITNVGLLPQQAKQTIVLKRVTRYNRRTSDIISKSTYTNGRGTIMSRENG